MKISKATSKVVASEEAVNTELNSMVFEDAQKSLKKTIDSLGAYAKRTGDKFAKECIANLSVILLDMKNHK